MVKTQKLKMVARFGSRYGRNIRARVLAIEEHQRKRHYCEQCGFKKVKRVSTAIYYCEKCGRKFAGGAYVLRTKTGKLIEKMVKQREFVETEKLFEENNPVKGRVKNV